MALSLTHIPECYIYDVFYHSHEKLIVIVMAGYIHTNKIVTSKDEIEQITYTTPEPPVIKFQEQNELLMFEVTKCIRQELSRIPKFNKPNTYIYTLPCKNYISHINIIVNEKSYENIFVNTYTNLANKIIMSTMVKNEDDYIIQWINYHMSLGVQHFIIYDNKDSPRWQFPSKSSSLKKKSNLKLVLDDYIKKGIVILINWPYKAELGFGGVNSGQHTQLNHCLYCFRECKYLCNYDVDEYINPQHYNTLEEQLNAIIATKKCSMDKYSCFQIQAKFFHNFNNYPTDGYNFLKITNCEEKTRKNISEKLIIIPKNTISVGPHRVFEDKPMLTLNENDIFFNHYYFLNKESRGRDETEFIDDSLLSKPFFTSKLENSS